MFKNSLHQTNEAYVLHRNPSNMALHPLQALCLICCKNGPVDSATDLLKKTGQSRPLFVYFRSFLITISIQIEKSVDGVLGIRTLGRKMVDAYETTELWRPPTDLFV